MNVAAHALEVALGWVGQASLSATVLFLIAQCVQRLFRKPLGVRGCYLLSLLVLVRLLVPFAPNSTVSWMNLFRPWRLSTADRPVFNALILPDVSTEAPVHVPKETAVWRMVHPSRFQLGTRAVVSCLWLSGAALLLLATGWRQRQFKKWAVRQPGGDDPRVARLLARARARLPVQGPIAIVLTEDGGTPALMGWRRPCLLLPRPVLGQLDDQELTMVLMHELAHVKRRDVLLNWGMIVAQSLHWFNPMIWIAMRRLRADRELVCDAMVLAALGKEEHRLYGGTLLKLLGSLSQNSLCPTLVPVLNNKHEIKMRISMIPKFRPSKRAAWAATTALLAVLCALTFTRAADQRKEPVAVAEAPSPPSVAPTSTRQATMDQLKERLNELDGRISGQQRLVDQLRQEARIPSDIADGHATSSLEPDTVRMIERERITSESMAARYEALYKELKAKSPAQLLQALPTAVPDAELSQLLRDLNMAESAYARLTQEFGPDNTQVKTTAKTMDTARAQIQVRIEGILSGLAAQVAAQRASSEMLSKQLDEVTQRDAESAQRYRPYFKAKRELMLLEKVRDELMLQYLQKQFFLPNE